MSRTGQAPQVPLVAMVDMVRPVVGLAAGYDHGHRIRRHAHPVAQLIFAAEGVMTVTTDAGAWVVPPLRAVWVPPHVPHAIRMAGRVEMRTIYVEPGGIAGLPDACSVVHVSPLLRELVLRAVGFAQPYAPQGPEARAAAVLLDEIRAATVAPLHLPRPTDPRLVRVAQALDATPDDGRALGAWARVAGASTRTLARLFQQETGMSFRAWRQQLRLVRALERLAAGDAVTTVALDLGYDSPSAFITMFKKALGATPSRYFGEDRPAPVAS